MNNGLKEGTQLPYIERAIDRGYAVIVTNTNQLQDKMAGRGNPEGHAATVWKELVQPSKARRVAIVAHSYGGVVTLELAKLFPADFVEQVFCIAFTDSVHSEKLQGVMEKPKLMRRLADISLNYVASEEELGTDLETRPKRYVRNLSKNQFYANSETPFFRFRIRRVSAGHDTHEWISYSAMHALFKRLDAMYEALADHEEL